MAVPISIDFRRRVVDAYNSGEGGYKKIAERFKISWNSVRRWVALQKRTNSLEPLPHKTGPDPKISQAQWPKLISFVAEKPDRTISELAEEWNRRFGTKIHASSMGRALRRAGLHLKKRHLGQQNGTAPMSLRKKKRI